MGWQYVPMAPPHDRATWGAIEVHLRDTRTGETRTHRTEGIVDSDGTLATYIWEDGNFACDCNRYLFFQQAGGAETREEDEVCGHERFDVWIVNPATGETVYDEREKP